MGARSNYSLVIIGSGPGVGRHIAKHFAEKKFNKIALLARNAGKLAEDKAAVEAAVPGEPSVRTYQVDISDEEQLHVVLKDVEADLGTPECVLFNAAVIAPTKLLEIDEAEMIHDFKVCEDERIIDSKYLHHLRLRAQHYMSQRNGRCPRCCS